MQAATIRIPPEHTQVVCFEFSNNLLCFFIFFQVENLKERLKESERTHRQEVESAQTHSDQSMLELRRKFDKLDMGYQEQIEKAQEKHEQEIGKWKQNYCKVELHLGKDTY